MAGFLTDLLQKLKVEFTSKAVWAIVALIGIIASWLWGWFAAGGPSRALGAIPSGAVVGFDLENGCPQGWSSYKEGGGRFLIGAVTKEQIGKIPGKFVRDARGVDLAPRPFGVPGGKQQHSLTIEEMPSHYHGVFRADSGADGKYPKPQYMAGYNNLPAPTDPSGVTGLTGSGAAYDIMPPYVAVWMCRKD